MTINQSQAALALSMEAKKILRNRVEFPATRLIIDTWRDTVGAIAAYAAGSWALKHAGESPAVAQATKNEINFFAGNAVKVFRQYAIRCLNTACWQAFRYQFLLDHWVLDQTTPPNIVVRPKRSTEYHPTSRPRRNIGVRESWFTDAPAGAQDHDQAGKPVASPESRLDSYLKAWGASAFAGMTIGAMTGDTPDQAAARIANAKAGPLDITAVMKRLISTEVQVAIADADDQFVADWGGLIDERYWQTMDDERVCPICRSQEGKAFADAVYDIPAHPRCRCWWKHMAKSWKKLAGEYAEPSADPGDMVARDPATNEPMAIVRVSFDRWQQSLTR
jgi:hypothetical protein